MDQAGRAKASKRKDLTYRGRHKQTLATDKGGEPITTGVETRLRAPKVMSQVGDDATEDERTNDRPEGQGTEQTRARLETPPDLTTKDDSRMPLTPPETGRGKETTRSGALSKTPTKRPGPAGGGSPAKKSKAETAPPKDQIIPFSLGAGNLYTGEWADGFQHWLDSLTPGAREEYTNVWTGDLKPLLAHMFSRQNVESFVREVDKWITETAQGEMLPVQIQPYEGEPPEVEKFLKQAARSHQLEKALESLGQMKWSCYNEQIKTYEMYASLERSMQERDGKMFLDDFFRRSTGKTRGPGDKYINIFKDYAAMRFWSYNPQQWASRDKRKYGDGTVNAFTRHLKAGRNLSLVKTHLGTLGIFLFAYAGGHKSE